MRFKIDIASIEKARKHLSIKRKMAITPVDYRSEIGRPIIIYFVLDISGSLRKFYGELVDCFNEIVIPSLKEANDRYKGSLRVGCLLFSGKLVPAWLGFKSLEQLGRDPFNRKMLNQPGLQGKTALYQAMKSGLLWTAAAMEHIRENGQGEVPKGKIIVLTDGANNVPPLEESAVTNAMSTIAKLDLRNLESKIVFLNTNEGLTKDQYEKMCKQTGFTPAGFLEISQDGMPGEIRSTFRNFFRVHASPAVR